MGGRLGIGGAELVDSSTGVGIPLPNIPVSLESVLGELEGSRQ